MRRAVLLILSSAWATCASAQSLGTKPDVVAKTSSGPIVQPMDLLQMVAALAVVGWLLKWALPKVIGRLGARAPKSSSESIVIEEATALGTGQLQVVTVRGRTLLLSVTTTGTSCLADLTAPPATELPEDPEPKAFFDYLDGASEGLSAADAETTTENEPTAMKMDDAIALIAAAKARLEGATAETQALDRLNRLTGVR